MIKGKHTFITRSRWLTPLCISMLAAAIFTQRAALYNRQITLLFAVVTLWAGAAWWPVRSARARSWRCVSVWSPAWIASASGACAAVVAATENGFCDKGEDITVRLRGGDLLVKYTDETVWMTGDAKKNFEGFVEL